ncbi:hypothetical protein NADFUDRAFT_40497 [Nadsonia fulvescens var. elongata DSM 6958]|uniref:Translation machinery-associated protein 16 n=1 Tax=Nadsonia fulvescens var. elongata DSM 6958 TaxID=857566 RepID=A0A1E3PQY5_9ASCO|nr:hypothetical protein NADFUDRAFT_40497 [Nadsonia fulvescens var. elongata DSM 6958]
MPVAKSLTKLKQKVKGAEKNLHLKSRKFRQINRATIREERINKQKHERIGAKEIRLLRTRFFKEAISTVDKSSFDLQDMKDLIEVFISRDDDELRKLKDARRPGRPASGRQDILQMKIEAEKKEYKTGYLMVDLSDVENVKFLRNWNGSQGGAGIIKFIRISDTTTELPTKPEEDVKME